MRTSYLEAPSVYLHQREGRGAHGEVHYSSRSRGEFSRGFFSSLNYIVGDSARQRHRRRLGAYWLRIIRGPQQWRKLATKRKLLLSSAEVFDGDIRQKPRVSDASPHIRDFALHNRRKRRGSAKELRELSRDFANSLQSALIKRTLAPYTCGDMRDNETILIMIR